MKYTPIHCGQPSPQSWAPGLNKVEKVPQANALVPNCGCSMTSYFKILVPGPEDHDGRLQI